MQSKPPPERGIVCVTLVAEVLDLGEGHQNVAKVFACVPKLRFVVLSEVLVQTLAETEPIREECEESVDVFGVWTLLCQVRI